MKFPAYTLILACLLCLPSAPGQEPPSASGHWQGSILNHRQEILIEVDLVQNLKGEWIGSIDIPTQNTKGLPLSDIVVKETHVTFAMKGPPGDPKFDGKLFRDGKAISGVYTQGEVSLTFSLRRTGDAVTPPNRTAIAKEMEGLWEGALESKGNTLRLKLKLSNQPDGTATGTLISVDQGGGEFPITTITQEGSNLKFEAKTIQGSYDGDLTNGTLVGYWTLGPAKLPLTFKRPQEVKK
jgi:hypothetical protein